VLDFIYCGDDNSKIPYEWNLVFGLTMIALLLFNLFLYKKAIEKRKKIV
jgi:hypothetical protein